MDIEEIRKINTVRVCCGSGVIVRPLDKAFLYVLTNYHVVMNENDTEKKLTFEFENGSPLDANNMSVLGKLLCKDKDVAILKIEASGFESVNFVRLNTTSTTPKFHVGFPKARYEGAAAKTNVLEVNSYGGKVNRQLVEYGYCNQVRKEEIEGMSGGGVFDVDFRLVGIHKQSSNVDERECLGKACYIPITCYKEALNDEEWSPILWFDLDSFSELAGIAFDFEDKYIKTKASELLYDIDECKARIEDVSPINVLQTLKDNNRLDKDVVIDELSREFWVEFTEFIIGMLIILDIDDTKDNFIIAIYDRFHFVFSQKLFDFYDVREKLDVNLLRGVQLKSKLVVGGLKTPAAFNGCVLDNRIPQITKAGIIDAKDIKRHKRDLLSKMTIVSGNIFKKCVNKIVDDDNPNISLEHYREVLLQKIGNEK